MADELCELACTLRDKFLMPSTFVHVLTCLSGMLQTAHLVRPMLVYHLTKCLQTCHLLICKFLAGVGPWQGVASCNRGGESS